MTATSSRALYLGTAVRYTEVSFYLSKYNEAYKKDYVVLFVSTFNQLTSFNKGYRCLKNSIIKKACKTNVFVITDYD